jgi:DNA-binding transcriptional ArsR family regulator
MTLTPLEAAVAVARALGHPGRLRMLAMLQSGELCVCQLTEVLRLAPSTVSLHLKELKRAGLVTERRDGRWVYLALSEDPEARPWIETALAALAGDPQLEADDEMVEELRRLPVEDLCRLGYEEARARQAAASARRRHRRSRDAE